MAVGLGAVMAVLYAGTAKRRARAGIPLTALAEPVPAARTLQPEEVLGPWQFYVDAATSTVTIELRGDGSYKQAIVGNRGEQIECPGGTWALDGPYLELTSYRSAAQGVTGPARWFFGDWQDQLVLFAKDDPQSETHLLAQRGEAGPIA